MKISFKNLFIHPYVNGTQHFSKAIASTKRPCCSRIGHFLAGVILMTPLVNTVAQVFLKKAVKSAPTTTSHQLSTSILSSPNKTHSWIFTPKSFVPCSVEKIILNNTAEANKIQATIPKEDPVLHHALHARLYSSGDPLEVWDVYLQTQGLPPGCKKIEDWTALPPFNLLERMSQLGVFGININEYWSPGFIRDCAIAYPDFIDFIPGETLFNFQILEIATVNSTFAWHFLQFEANKPHGFGADEIPTIFYNAFGGIKEDFERCVLHPNTIVNLAKVLKDYDKDVKKEHYNQLKKLIKLFESHPSGASFIPILKPVLKQWKTQTNT